MGMYRLRFACVMIASATLYSGGIILACTGQQHPDPEDTRMLVLRVVKGNQGDLWEASFLK